VYKHYGLTLAINKDRCQKHAVIYRVSAPIW